MNKKASHPEITDSHILSKKNIRFINIQVVLEFMEADRKRELMTKEDLLDVMDFYASTKDLKRDPVLHVDTLIKMIINSMGLEIPLNKFGGWLWEIAKDPDSKFVIDKRDYVLTLPTRFYQKGYEPSELKKQAEVTHQTI